MNKQLKERLETNKGKILYMLEQAGDYGVTGHELNRICNRYGACIHKLRKEGYKITRGQVKEGLFNYTLEKKLQPIPLDTALNSLLEMLQDEGVNDSDIEIVEELIGEHFSLRYRAGTFVK